jgi:membrane protein
VAFEVMKTVFAEYVACATYNLVYGTFAAIPIFLLWVYLSWLIVLFGAEFTAFARLLVGRERRRRRTGITASRRTRRRAGAGARGGGPPRTRNS